MDTKRDFAELLHGYRRAMKLHRDISQELLDDLHAFHGLKPSYAKNELVKNAFQSETPGEKTE